MWAEILQRLPEYKNAVISSVNAEGYPSSVRCKPEPDSDMEILKVKIPCDVHIQPGPASLLCHKHDEGFWNQHSFIVWGRLEQKDGDWIFHPLRFTPGASPDMLNLVRFVMAARHAAKQYLEKRGLPRPAIPWNEIKALWAEVERTKQ